MLASDWSHSFLERLFNIPTNLASSEQGCQIFLVHDTKNGKNIPNEHEMYQIVIKYLKSLLIIPNGHKKYQQLPI
jgi:hypothetical protein